MRPGALRGGCMVGMFWDAEVRCCIVVKPFHLESCLPCQRAAVLVEINPEWNFIYFQQHFISWEFFSTYLYSKDRHKNCLLPTTLSTCKTWSEAVPLFYSNTVRGCCENLAEPGQVLVQVTFLHSVLFLGVAFSLPICWMTPETMPLLGTYASTVPFELTWCWDAKNVTVLAEQ